MYKILLLPTAQKDLDKFKGKTFDILVKKISSLKENPRPHGCLKLTAEQGYRIRSGNYRIIYRIDDKKKKVFIYRIKHRKEAY
ncbi:MAG: type II toxin-antitoxin system RelE/ParE family toxin [Candidatus Aminicenantes bacterium]|nr:type II toxin-antitoxin system RelE/ParE family toxin [Candidatus Aminicenantes bacterium]HHF52474.1 type II toxin-antitoxin system RelE/ParE family toxin [Candidatus Aminicenantes bacterium]